MAITFTVASERFPDNVALSTTASAIQTWLNSTLTVTTLYTLYVEHVSGFYVAICVYA